MECEAAADSLSPSAAFLLPGPNLQFLDGPQFGQVTTILNVETQTSSCNFAIYCSVHTTRYIVLTFFASTDTRLTAQEIRSLQELHYKPVSTLVPTVESRYNDDVGQQGIYRFYLV